MKLILSIFSTAALLVCFNGHASNCKPTACENYKDKKQTKSVSCKMKRIVSGEGQKATIRTIPIENDAYKSSAGLDVGELNYSFDMIYEDGTVSIFFYENNQVQDEVGSTYFEIDGTVGRFIENIQNDKDENILMLECWENF
jgi:hypothetical protein